MKALYQATVYECTYRPNDIMFHHVVPNAKAMVSVNWRIFTRSLMSKTFRSVTITYVCCRTQKSGRGGLVKMYEYENNYLSFPLIVPGRLQTIGNLYPAEIYSRTASNGEQFSKSQIKGALVFNELIEFVFRVKVIVCPPTVKSVHLQPLSC